MMALNSALVYISIDWLSSISLFVFFLPSCVCCMVYAITIDSACWLFCLCPANRTSFMILLFSQYLRNVKIPCFFISRERKCTKTAYPLFSLFPVRFLSTSGADPAIVGMGRGHSFTIFHQDLRLNTKPNRVKMKLKKNIHFYFYRKYSNWLNCVQI